MYFHSERVPNDKTLAKFGCCHIIIIKKMYAILLITDQQQICNRQRNKRLKRSYAYYIDYIDFDYLKFYKIIENIKKKNRFNPIRYSTCLV